MNELVYVRDPDRNLIFINNAAENVTGWSLEKAKKKKCYEVFGDEKKQCLDFCPVDRSIEMNCPISHIEGELADFSGKLRKMKVSITPMTDGSRVSGAVVVMQDVTLLENLQETQVKTMIRLERERNLFAAGPVVIFQRKNETRWPVDYVSPNITSMLGYSALQFISGAISYAQIIHPSDLDRVTKEVRMFCRSKPSHFSVKPYRLLSLDGKEIWVMDSIKTVRDEGGSIKAFLSYIVDISDRIRFEEALNQNDRFLNAVFNSIQDGIAVLDKDLTIIASNCAMETLFSYKLPLAGKKCFNLYYDRQNPCEVCVAIKCMQTGTLEKKEISLEASEKPDTVLELYTFPMLGRDGKPAGVVEYVKDITEKKQTENLLRIQRDLAIRLGSTNDLNQAFEAILAAVLEIKDIHSAGIYLVDPDEGSLSLVKYKNLPDWFVRQGSFFPGNSTQSRLVLEGKPVFSSYEDILVSLNLSKKEIARKKASGIKGLAIIPIQDGKNIIGALNSATHSLEGFNQFSKYALEAIAVQIGEVITKIRTHEMLYTSRMNFQTLFESLKDFLFVLDMDGYLLAYNPAARKKLGYSRKTMEKMHVLDLHPKHRREETIQIIEKMIAGELQYCPVPLVTRKGELIPVETHVTIGKWNGRQAIFGISRDISDRVAAQKARQVSEDRLATAIEAIGEGFALYDPEDRLTLFNTRYAEMFGAFKSIIHTGALFEDIIHHCVRHGHYEGEDVNQKKWLLKRMALHQKGGNVLEQKLNTGKWLKIIERKTPDGGTVEFNMDITDSKTAEEKLRKSLNEKEALLKEVHHRVKNNMQIVSSLLSLQRRKLKDAKAAAAFEETEDRLHAMSLVHEILYRSDNILGIDFQAYLEKLVSYLSDIFMGKIKIEIQAQHIRLKMEHAVTCGLIVNELITNALKHAFPDNREGCIRISADTPKDSHYRVCIQDDGIGLPSPFDWEKTGSLGLRLVRELTRGQLEGSLDVKTKNGVCWTIEWQDTEIESKEI